MRALGWIVLVVLVLADAQSVVNNEKLRAILEKGNGYTQHRHIEQVIDPSLPKSFDGREEWPGCIHEVLDQGACGSCWAFAASETLSDRFCIHSNNTVNVVLSPQNLLSCEALNLGCTMGSLPMWAWRYLYNYGITTIGCVPYVNGHGGSTEKCTYDSKTCTGGGKFELYKAASYTQVGSIVQPSHHTVEIMKALMEGPVDATFNVWGDFMAYNGGVYKHKSGGYEGLHSIKIIGWGEENGEPYWLVQNSWGKSWGPYHGYFKILRGQDECFIESLVYTGYPDLSHH
eukprot:TRINITY_DN9999_c0_g1_i1.p1 TRINITY_DN9999_c0_g1~~TRINITY_DN9999_c0_g1_i1.p1  ORF type:complete len:287 (+),score=48.56 TRINITY_DN9999_c0_g1_i1:48-908(+)